MDKYILDNRKPVRADLMTWARWFETADRQVARTTVGNVRISTVFLGIDHSFGDGPPLLFESMAFGLPAEEDGEWQERCATWEQAEAMHAALVERAKSIPQLKTNPASEVP